MPKRRKEFRDPFVRENSRCQAGKQTAHTHTHLHTDADTHRGRRLYGKGSKGSGRVAYIYIGDSGDVTLVLQTAFLRPRVRIRIGARCIPNDIHALSRSSQESRPPTTVPLRSRLERARVHTSVLEYSRMHTMCVRCIHMSATNAPPHKPQFFTTRNVLAKFLTCAQTVTTASATLREEHC